MYVKKIQMSNLSIFQREEVLEVEEGRESTVKAVSRKTIREEVSTFKI